MKTPRADDHVSDRLGDHLEGDLSLAEFARVDAHLEECSDCAAELRELRATVALLRGLPDPEPPSDLAANVMRRVKEGEGREARAVSIFRRVAEPRFAAALAAGVAGLMFFSATDFGAGDVLGNLSESSRNRIAMQDDSGGATDVRVMGASRPHSLLRTPLARPSLASRHPRNALVAFDRGLPPQRPTRIAQTPGFGFFGNSAPEVPLRDLDGEFEELMQDPAAFLERIRRTEAGSRRTMVSPLVAYSARRGDAAAVARFAGAAAGPMVVPVSTR